MIDAHLGGAAANGGHEAGPTLMGSEDEVDSLGAPDRLHVIDPAAAGDTEQMTDADLRQCFGHNLGYGFV